MPTLLGANDAERLLAEIRKRPRRYQELRAMLGDDPERAVAAVDALIVAGKIDRMVIGTASHFRAAP